MTITIMISVPTILRVLIDFPITSAPPYIFTLFYILLILTFPLDKKFTYTKMTTSLSNLEYSRK